MPITLTKQELKGLDQLSHLQKREFGMSQDSCQILMLRAAFGIVQFDVMECSMLSQNSSCMPQEQHVVH